MPLLLISLQARVREGDSMLARQAGPPSVGHASTVIASSGTCFGATSTRRHDGT